MRKKENELMESIYELYSGIIYKNAVKIVRDEHEAKDIIQHVMLKFYQKYLNRINNYTSGEIRALLYKMSRNASFDFLKKKKKLQSHEELTNFISSYRCSKNIETEVTDRIYYNELFQETLEKLKPEYAEIIVLYYKQNYSQKEIAIKLKVSYSTTGSKLCRAKKSFRNKMDRKL